MAFQKKEANFNCMFAWVKAEYNSPSASGMVNVILNSSIPSYLKGLWIRALFLNTEAIVHFFFRLTSDLNVFIKLCLGSTVRSNSKRWSDCPSPLRTMWFGIIALRRLTPPQLWGVQEKKINSLCSTRLSNKSSVEQCLIINSPNQDNEGNYMSHPGHTVHVRQENTLHGQHKKMQTLHLVFMFVCVADFFLFVTSPHLDMCIFYTTWFVCL